RRFDLSATGRAPVPPAPVPEATPEPAGGPQLRAIPQPAYLVLAIADAPAGHLSPHDRQVLGAARLLADAGGGAVVLLAADIPADAGEAGADRVAPLPADADPDRRAATLLEAIAALQPRHVLWPESRDGGDLARRVAVRLGEALFCGAEQVNARLVSRPARSGGVEQRRAPPRLLTLADGAAAPHRATRHAAQPIALPAPAPAASGAILHIEEVPADPATVPLAEAEFVVSAGNGVTDFAAFAALARALAATPGASRMVCDAGLMPRAAQVGASGTVLQARCYFALGIAGAPQHLQGVAGCEHVVAVNTDLHAAMIERASLAIVADAQAVMPALIALMAEGEA
ncbi:electron transfer flavoprotein subunit alpha/FixB family protein, partial [Xanthobacter autotrophicus DSM 431]|uniref:electron transfer flavoprotein subunit alpha/FixB family protein n=1 Tax=Xanthobacter nonsaccharivorans TaxID=3119912 RepID=UPI00372C17D0